MARIRARDWVFTINNYTDEDLKQLEKAEKDCQYLIYGFEKGEKGTPHVQGYVEFKNPRQLGGVKQIIGERGHYETRKGTMEEARKYTKKEGNWIERGETTKTKQGKRTDIDEIKKAVKEGKNMGEIIDNIQNYQQLKYAEGLLKYQKCTKTRNVEVIWKYGETGTGKTREAIEEAGDDYWISGKSLRWWEGYQGQKTVIIDDFRKDFCTYHELLRILDIYPYRVEYKGGSTWLMATKIIITSAFHPTKVYETREDIQQLLRRITDIQERTKAQGTEVNGVILDPLTTQEIRNNFDDEITSLLDKY